MLGSRFLICSWILSIAAYRLLQAWLRKHEMICSLKMLMRFWYFSFWSLVRGSEWGRMILGLLESFAWIVGSTLLGIYMARSCLLMTYFCFNAMFRPSSSSLMKVVFVTILIFLINGSLMDYFKLKIKLAIYYLNEIPFGSNVLNLHKSINTFNAAYLTFGFL